MKRLAIAILSVLLLSAAPAFALNGRFDGAQRENLNKGVSSEVSNDRFENARRGNLENGR